MTPRLTRLVDLSSNNGWPSAALLATLDGVILRCAYNLGEDREFEAFVASAKRANLPWSAYHFIKPGDGAAQAEFALRILDRVGGCPVLFMDREYEYGVIASPATADAYIARVQKAGLRAGTYSQLSLYSSFGADIDWPAVWSANQDAPYMPPVYHAGDFLQIAGDGTPAGNHIDRDIFNGTPADLRALFGAGRVPAPVPHKPPIVPVPPHALPGGGDAMFNLIPGTAARTVFLKQDALLYDHSVGGTRYSKADASDEFPYLGGAGDRIVVADGDYAVFANRADIVRTTQDSKNYGV